MMAAIVIASIMMGLILVWWITVVMATALTSWSQEWRQRKVRYGRGGSAQALASEVEAHADPPAERDERPWLN
jgi:hypothetical protein